MSKEMVREAIKEISTTLMKKSASSKDEVRVMKAMLNDTKYAVKIFDNKGNHETYNPSSSVREMAANIISTTTRMPKSEAAELASHYEFTRSDAEAMIDFSKEFINTYMQTGRKMNLGIRETTDVNLSIKNIPSKVKAIPARDGKPADKVTVPAFSAIKAQSKCPKHLKK